MGGDVVIREGDVVEDPSSPALYMIYSGEAKAFKKDELVYHYQTAGASFGELALLYSCPRAATVRATADGTVLWSIGRGTFNHLIRDCAMRKAGEIERTLGVEGKK